MKTEIYLSATAPTATSPAEALAILAKDLREKLAKSSFNEDDLVLTRFFSSDAARHAELIDKSWPMGGQKILIGQAPLDSRYLSLQAWALKGDIEKNILPDGSMSIRHGAYHSLWSIETPRQTGGSEAQTDDILAGLQSRLWKNGMTLEDNALRTWYYMRDIDNNYAGMIKSRVRHYEIRGLTPRTHFIASTGIEAQGANPATLSWVHCHAIKGAKPEQIKYLRAADNMSSTAIYGVNFERGTLATYGDRKHAHISGTASIDTHGQVLHIGDPIAQTARALENIRALLQEAGMTFDDLKAATVYCRDGHDYERIKEVVGKTLPPDCAVNYTRASVCRPDWLVEIEGEAVLETPTKEFDNYL